MCAVTKKRLARRSIPWASLFKAGAKFGLHASQISSRPGRGLACLDEVAALRSEGYLNKLQGALNSGAPLIGSDYGAQLPVYWGTVHFVSDGSTKLLPLLPPSNAFFRAS